MFAGAGVVVILAQACGGGSAGADTIPTAKPLSTLAAGSETPALRRMEYLERETGLEPATSEEIPAGQNARNQRDDHQRPDFTGSHATSTPGSL